MVKRQTRNTLAWSLLAVVGLCLTGCQSEGVLNPKGVIAFQERQLLFDSLALMLIVVIPVIVMSFVFVARYHDTHPTAEYRPNWCHSVTLESIWWGVPMGIILVLGIMTWTMTHELDPYRRIEVPGEPLEVQAVALPWKWLFIYPEQNIATVNYLQLPKGKQVRFYLSTDNVPMSSFFIPQLGSQIYTMAGMRTQLHLIPTHIGKYRGLNSQYNGEGFSDMFFTVNVVKKREMKAWFDSIKSKETATLDGEQYAQLRQPSIADPVKTYSNVAPNLFQTIVDSYHAADHPQCCVKQLKEKAS